MVDILLATYNGEKYVRQQIDSLLNQEDEDGKIDFRIVISDDGSNDGTKAIIDEYILNYPWRFVLLENEEHFKNARDNFLSLVKKSEGEYVMFADQDDVWDKNKLKLSYIRMKKMENKYGSDIPILVHSDLLVVDENLEVIAPSFLDFMNLPRKKDLRDVIIQNSVTGCTMMINSRLRDMMAEADYGSPIIMHDQFAAILAATFGRISLIDKPLVSYRQHGDNEVGASAAHSIDYKLARFVRGKTAFQEDMMKSYEQVEYIINKYDISDCPLGVMQVLLGYANLKYCNKTDRILFYNKNKIYKNGNTRRLVQMLWS